MKFSCQNQPLRFSLAGSKLRPDDQGVFRWHIESFTEDQDKFKTIQAFAGAFDILADHFWPITFRSSNTIGDADIVLRFRHNSDPDLPDRFEEGVLAYAFLPGTSLQGNLFLNDEYEWQEMMSGGRYDLLTVVLHELLHNLGVGHSENEDAVMYWQYSGAKEDLHNDDTAAINKKYGRMKKAFLKLPKAAWVRDRKGLCNIFK